MEHKISLWGDTGVGKTSLIIKLINKTFDQSIKRTLLPEKYKYILQNKKINFWDSIGQGEYNVFGSINYRDCTLILLLYDINNEVTKERVNYWYKEIRELNDNQLPIIILANKIDLLKENKEIIKLNNDKNIFYLKISTKTDENLEELKKIIFQIINTNKRNSIISSKQSLKLYKSKKKMQNKNSCC